MSRLLLMFRRELWVFAVSPVFWVIASLAWLLSGIVFRYISLVGSGGDVSLLVQSAGVLCIRIQIIFVPLLTMRMLAEEKRTGTFEMLVTAPARDHEVVLAKFLAAWVMNALIWLIIPVWFLLFSSLGVEPDFGVVMTTYCGAILIGAVFIAAGIMTSAMTQHQILAGFFSFVILMILLFLPSVTVGLEGSFGRALNLVLREGYLGHQMTEASMGIIDVVSITYQVCITGVFLLLATRILEVRKWR